jgi:hypothetical protein
MVDMTILAQGLDHRVQLSELLAHPRLQDGRRGRRRLGHDARARARAASQTLFRRDLAGGDDLDNRSRTKPEEPPPPDLAR